MILFDVLPMVGEMVIFVGIMAGLIIIFTLGIVGFLVAKMFKRK